MDDFQTDKTNGSGKAPEFSYIDRSDLVAFGMPRISGTRLTVWNIVHDLTYQSVDTVSTERDLGQPVLVEALTYCASQSCGIDSRNAFCSQCSKGKMPGDELPGESFVDGWEIAAHLIATLKGIPEQPEA